MESIVDYFLKVNVWTIVVFFTVFLVSYFYLKNRRLPPGPYGLPIVGYLPFQDLERLSAQLNELCEKYHTDILCFSGMNNREWIILNSYELIKEVFQKRSDVVDRGDTSLFHRLDENYSGIIGSSGPEWREGRRLSIAMLKNFGMGRIGAEERIQQEAHILNKYFETDEAFDPQQHINVSVSNIISGMVFGETFEHDDEEFCASLQAMNDSMVRLSGLRGMLMFWSTFARKFFFADLWQECVDDFQTINRFVEKKIEEHRESYTGEVTDFIHGYMKEMEDGDSDILDEHMMRSLVIDFFFAGSETTTTTLRWGLLAMAAHPDIQQRVYKELEEVIGDREPSMNDKTNTPYTEATLCEIQRHYTLLQFGLSHANLNNDIEIRGYLIPKKTFIIANMNQVHHDKNFWKNPDNFDPENFLEDGKVANTERLIPFGIGRRACAGEALARMELYIFFANILKEFEVKPETDDMKVDLTGNLAGVFQPKPFKIRMVKRQ